MSKVLVKWNDFDENELIHEGFLILESEVWNTKKKILEKVNRKFEVCVGSDIYITYDYGVALLKRIRACELDDSEIEIIGKYFSNMYGVHTFLDDVADYE